MPTQRGGLHAKKAATVPVAAVWANPANRDINKKFVTRDVCPKCAGVPAHFGPRPGHTRPLRRRGCGRGVLAPSRACTLARSRGWHPRGWSETTRGLNLARYGEESLVRLIPFNHWDIRVPSGEPARDQGRTRAALLQDARGTQARRLSQGIHLT